MRFESFNTKSLQTDILSLSFAQMQLTFNLPVFFYQRWHTCDRFWIPAFCASYFQSFSLFLFCLILSSHLSGSCVITFFCSIKKQKAKGHKNTYQLIYILKVKQACEKLFWLRRNYMYDTAIIYPKLQTFILFLPDNLKAGKRKVAASAACMATMDMGTSISDHANYLHWNIV